MIQISEMAKKRILHLMKEQPRKVEGLRLAVSGSNPRDVQYNLAFVEEGKSEPSDLTVEAEGLKLFVEPKHATLLEDIKIDFVETLTQTGFKVENLKSIPPPTAAPTEPPNLETPEAKAVQKVLDEQINPSVAAHGGFIGLIDVKDHVAYIRLSGGCQGCGMADVTLKQGVIVAIKKSVPEIQDILDVTDHASGNNPYFSPGK